MNNEEKILLRKDICIEEKDDWIVVKPKELKAMCALIGAARLTHETHVTPSELSFALDAFDKLDIE